MKRIIDTGYLLVKVIKTKTKEEIKQKIEEEETLLTSYEEDQDDSGYRKHRNAIARHGGFQAGLEWVLDED